MKRTLLAVMTVLIVLALTGCGGGGSSAPPPTITTQILSDPTIDGDIQVPTSGPAIVTEGMSFPTVQSVFAGIDPVTFAESRAFLDFPLSSVPVNATIVSATLDIVIDSVVSSIGAVPIRVDLINFPPPLIASDFDLIIQAPIDTIFIGSITSADINTHVFIDVTSFMVQAQSLGLSNFQVRILEELGPVTQGLIEINDSTDVNRGSVAPLLEVTYF